MIWKSKFPEKNLYYETGKGILYCGNCLDILRLFPGNCIDSVITDPPYGLSNLTTQKVAETLHYWLKGEDDYVPSGRGFMNARWDSFVPPPAIWKEIHRVMKPGAIILVFAGTRTYDLMTIALRLAGFEIRDSLMWLYSSGMPKGVDISKQIDKKLGVKRRVVGKGKSGRTRNVLNAALSPESFGGEYDITEPGSPEAKKWEGYRTGLKPAWEPIIMAMKPTEGGFADNALKWNVGGLNTEETRIGTEEISVHDAPPGTFAGGKQDRGSIKNYRIHQARFPANVLLDEESAQIVEKQSRGTSRFFYVAKASNKERNMGLPAGKRNQHPTVKPIKLLQYLATLLKMPNENQIYLDPFMGSGSTAIAIERIGRNWIGIEMEEEYCDIASKRIEANKSLL